MATPDNTRNAEFRPGLILGETARDAGVDTTVRTDVSSFVRVRWSPEPLDPSEEGVQALAVSDLPGSTDTVKLPFKLEHHELTEWQEEVFAHEFRTQRPSLVRLYFANGGVTVHLVDLTFSVPPFDPADLEEDEDPEVIAEQRLDAAFFRFYSWTFERLDDFGGGGISQICLPELWLRQVHLLPTVWGMAASFARRTGNRFVVADACPPFGMLQDAERARARAEGYELTPEELTPAALIPWFREDKWRGREDVATEVALTLDALRETRESLRRSELTLSCLAVYWPWVRNHRGMNLPPCGAISGVYARSDDENGPVGVMKPPANEEIKGIQDISLHVDEWPRNLLQRAGVNLLQSRTGRGIIVWGARTLSVDDLWRFVNVRRLIGYIGKQLDMDNQWAVFELNGEPLRERVERDTKYFLHDLYELGALAGDTPEQAYRVKCNEENNPDGIRDAGILVIDVWVNPVQTNEFVHLQLKYGDASVQ